jgi:hypothetical protein
MKISYKQYLKEVETFFTAAVSDESIKAMYEVDEANKDHGERFKKECKMDKMLSEMFG